MPSAIESRVDSTGPDDLDRLLDYDNAVDDFLKDIPVGNDDTNAPTLQQHQRDEDQEVQIKRKRKPIPKLDEHRLLSTAGIPRLRKITKTRLKFRGKGHEFSDITRLLNTYQLWLDDLYPRAKFRDALSMVEKVGHSKRMQIERKAWLDETKPGRRELTPQPEMLDVNGSDEQEDQGLQLQPDRAESGHATVAASEPYDRDHRDNRTTLRMDEPVNDPRGCLPIETGGSFAETVSSARAGVRDPFQDDDGPDADELHDLLSRSPKHTKQFGSRRVPFQEDSDDDELDALMMEQADEAHAVTGQQIRGPPSEKRNDVDRFADDEEALAALEGEQ